MAKTRSQRETTATTSEPSSPAQKTKALTQQTLLDFDDINAQLQMAQTQPQNSSAAGATSNAGTTTNAKKSVAKAATQNVSQPLRAQTDAQKTISVPMEKLNQANAQEKAEPSVLTISALNKSIKELLEGRFQFIWVKGEISNFKAHTSGHHYFSLKDADSQISAVMFKGFNSQLKFKPTDGMEVLVRGKVTAFAPRGQYQIFCELMEPVGAGALQKAFEQLKAKLQSEGLFEQSRKRPLPDLPKHIAIVTSPTGAAIRDMLNILSRRFKGAQITIIPTKVQGNEAPAEIIAAIGLAQKLKDIDVMIVGRGGGSIEDLWAFNDEGVARAIASCRVPTISAVGHEIDFTIADFVADLRAPTPSAAAELVVKNVADLIEQIQQTRRRLARAMQNFTQNLKLNLTHLTKQLVDPKVKLEEFALRCDELTTRLENSVFRYLRDRETDLQLLKEKLGSPEARVKNLQLQTQNLQKRLMQSAGLLTERPRTRLQSQMALLDSLSPLRVVERGYSIVTVAAAGAAGDEAKSGAVVTDANVLRADDLVAIRFAKGEATAKIVNVKKLK